MEAKFTDSSGRLDLPANLRGVDLLYAVDHRLPYRDTTLVPRQVKRMLLQHELAPLDVVRLLTDATVCAMQRYHGLVVAHLYSFLPKVGLSEAIVPTQSLMKLAETAIQTGAVVELDERWRCPSVRAALLFADAGVTLWASTDAHRAKDIGRYDYVAHVARELASATPERALGCAA